MADITNDEDTVENILKDAEDDLREHFGDKYDAFEFWLDNKLNTKLTELHNRVKGR